MLTTMVGKPPLYISSVVSPARETTSIAAKKHAYRMLTSLTHFFVFAHRKLSKAESKAALGYAVGSGQYHRAEGRRRASVVAVTKSGPQSTSLCTEEDDERRELTEILDALEALESPKASVLAAGTVPGANVTGVVPRPRKASGASFDCRRKNRFVIASNRDFCRSSMSSLIRYSSQRRLGVGPSTFVGVVAS